MGKSEQNRVNLKMGIDLRKQGRTRTRHFRKTTTNNLYHGLLIKLYSFLARRTDSKFNQIVHKRLDQSATTRYPMSISRLTKVANTEEKRSMTFDQLAKEAPKGQNTWLLRGHRSREAMRHWGIPRDGAKPYAKGSHEKKKKIK